MVYVGVMIGCLLGGPNTYCVLFALITAVLLNEFNLLLAEHGLAHPLTVCRDCEHYNEDSGRCDSEEVCRHV